MMGLEPKHIKESNIHSNMSKSVEERLEEVMVIYKKLKDLGIDEHTCQGITEFKKIANYFVKDGHSASGKIKLYEANRTLVYTLTMQPHIASNVVLKIIDPKVQ